MIRKILSLCAAAFLAGPMTGVAGVVNDVSSCYSRERVGIEPAAPGTELFVLIDQTVVLDDNLRATVMEDISPFIRHGKAYTVATFSAFSQGRYLQIVSSGYIEPAIPDAQRDDVSRRVLDSFDVCMARQESTARKHVVEVLNAALNAASQSLERSEILASLLEFSQRVRVSTAREKVVLLISDTLENSTVSSFYANNSVRRLNVSQELKKVESTGLFADFSGARVYVIGAGLLSARAGANSHASAGYRDSITLRRLADFWSGYFKRSNGDLRGFGDPALLVPVK